MANKIIFPDSDEAAHFQRVEGWVSGEGRFYGKDEKAARWGGATHVRCSKCGAPCPKNWITCEACRAKKAEERYQKMPAIFWNEKMLVYSPIIDEYYWSVREVKDTEGTFDPVKLQLVLCRPIFAPSIDPESYYEDLLPEYDELEDVSQGLVDMFWELNSRLTKDPIVLSYEPTDMAVI